MSEEKPDGYVAWHPKHGFSEFNDERGFNPKRKSVRFLELFKRKNEAVGDFAYAEPGWRIRPVKLVFLDETKSEGEG